MAPPALMEPWDNSGLQVGARSAPVKSILTALDPAPDVIEAACRAQIDMLITHHPLLFKPLTVVDLESPGGRLLARALQCRLNIYSLHTPLDKVQGGLNDMLAQHLHLQDLQVFIAAGDGDRLDGLGRCGVLKRAMRLEELAADVKTSLDIPHVRVAGPPRLLIRNAVICSGSGGGLVDAFLASEAGVYISGDIGYHSAQAIRDAGRCLIDIGHYYSERIAAPELARRLTEACGRQGYEVAVSCADVETDVFKVI